MSKGNSPGENLAKCSTKTVIRALDNEENALKFSLRAPTAENHNKSKEVPKKSSTRADKPAQTELSLSKHKVLNSVLSTHAYFSETTKQARKKTDWPVNKEENSDEDYPQQESSVYESRCTETSNPLYDTLMNNRKNMFGSRGSDLERKKLEAELKAAQEIARIQQTIIEKRLALELASIQNGKEGKDGKDGREHIPLPTHHTPKAQPDFVMMEEVARRNVATENGYLNEMESQKIRPKPVPSISGRLVNSERLRAGFGNEMLYKRSNSPDNYASCNNPPNGMPELQTPEVKYYNPSQIRMKRPQVPVPVQIQMSSHREEIYERPGWPGSQPRNRFSWRSFMGKLKRGLRHKPREDWE